MPCVPRRGAQVVGTLLRTIGVVGLSACTAIPLGDRVDLPDGAVPVDHGVMVDDALAEQVDALLVPIVEAGGVNVGVALVQGDRVVLTAAYGWADVASERVLTVDTPMAMASVSKTFIGIAAMQGVEAGRLTLDDPVGDLVGFPIDNPRVDGETIRLRHLLTHNAGVEDTAEYDNSYRVDGPSIGLETFLRGYVTPGGAYYRSGNYARRAPNEAFSYTNVGAGLAALAVGASAELEFAELVRRDILDPLGMENSGYFVSDLPVAPATQYNDARRPYVPYTYPTYPDGMMRSSPNDMARYLAMVQGNGTVDGVTLLSEQSVAELLTVDPSLGTDEYGQAIVWARLGLAQGRLLMGHTGGDYGTIAVLGLDRDTGAGVMLMVNADPTDFNALVGTLGPMLDAVDGLAE